MQFSDTQMTWITDIVRKHKDLLKEDRLDDVFEILPKRLIKDVLASHAFFMYCYENIPDLLYRIKTIPGYAFYDAKLDTDLVFPNNITRFAPDCFHGLRAQSITLPDNLESTSSNMFYNVKLKTLILPSKLQTINHNCFISAKITEPVKLPDSITYISRLAFQKSTINFVHSHKLSGLVAEPDLQTCLQEYSPNTKFTMV